MILYLESKHVGALLQFNTDCSCASVVFSYALV